MPSARRIHKYPYELFNFFEKLKTNHNVVEHVFDSNKTAQRLRFELYGLVNAVRKELARDLKRSEDALEKLSQGKLNEYNEIIQTFNRHEFQIDGKKMKVVPINQTWSAQAAKGLLAAVEESVEKQQQELQELATQGEDVDLTKLSEEELLEQMRKELEEDQ